MAEHELTITYDPDECEYTVSIPTLEKSASAPTLLDAMAWLCKIISDPEE